MYTYLYVIVWIIVPLFLEAPLKKTHGMGQLEELTAALRASASIPHIADTLPETGKSLF